MESDTGNSFRQQVGSHEFALQISSGGEQIVELSRRSGNPRLKSASETLSSIFREDPSNMQLRKPENLEPRFQIYTPKASQSPSQPVSDTGIKQKLLVTSPYAKPKSRLVEPPYPTVKMVEENVQPLPAGSPYRASPVVASPSNGVTFGNPRENVRSSPIKENGKAPIISSKPSTPITPKTPLMASPIDEDDEDEDDAQVYQTYENIVEEIKKQGKKVKTLLLIEWILFVILVGLLISSKLVDKLSQHQIWGLHIWRWSVLLLVIFCGRLVTGWFINSLVFMIERNYLFKRKVLYFVHALRKSVRVCLWLSLILLSWVLLVRRGVKRSHNTNRILDYITRGIGSLLIGAAMWVLKTLLIKLLASSFHVKTFFDRIQESIFHQYILQILSGPPLRLHQGRFVSASSSGRLSFKSFKSTKQGKQKEIGEEIIDVDKLYKMRKEKISAWTMGGLMNVVKSSGLYTITDAIDEADNEENTDQREIRSEVEAKVAANQIFKHVAKAGKKHIDEDDLLLFMPKEEVDKVLPLFKGAVETRTIKRSVFRKWVVQVYQERKYLGHSLNDADTTIHDLNKIVSVLVITAIIVVLLLLMEITRFSALTLIFSQLLLLVFVFGNTLKTIFEAIIFVFVMHPFDVGDKCVVNGVQMTVEQMNILTTVFLRYDNEKIYYPNCILSTMPISNFNRSPDMGDSVEFAIDFSTSVESIASLKAKVKEYIDGKPQHWRPSHSIQFKEIEDVNKMRMALYVTHTVNYQSPERGDRRSELVLKLKLIFEEIGIKYHLLPQEVQIRYAGSASTPPLAFMR